MPILKKSDVEMNEIAPGVERWELINGELGADSLTVADLTISPGSRAPTHTHPTEEAMLIVDGELQAVLGDEIDHGKGRRDGARSRRRQARLRQRVRIGRQGPGDFPDGEGRADARRLGAAGARPGDCEFSHLRTYTPYDIVAAMSAGRRSSHA